MDCSDDFNSEANAKSDIFQPKASIKTSIVPRCPEPGLPTLTRFPFRSPKFRIPESALATTVKGSGCTEKIARNSLFAPLSLNLLDP